MMLNATQYDEMGWTLQPGSPITGPIPTPCGENGEQRNYPLRLAVTDGWFAVK